MLWSWNASQYQSPRSLLKNLKTPTIGIGAGAVTDGQVLVMQDLLGLNPDFNPKFARKYLNGAELFTYSF